VLVCGWGLDDRWATPEPPQPARMTTTTMASAAVVVGSDEMNRKVGQKVDHERGDDHDSDHPGSADSRSATFGIRFGGPSLVVLIARL
jgi:hypothetical protein